jgi:hypothetical protein
LIAKATTASLGLPFVFRAAGASVGYINGRLINKGGGMGKFTGSQLLPAVCWLPDNANPL